MRPLLLLSASLMTGALVMGAAVGCGYEPHRPDRFAPAEDHNADLWRAAAGECLRSGRTWSQGMVDGVVVGRCSTLPSLGIGPVVARARR
jgi:hypothetical protein